jgi:hypothetical protein
MQLYLGAQPGTRPMNRAQPRLPAQSMKTYAIYQPVDTHFRTATCEEVECKASQNGWITRLNVKLPEQAELARWIRDHSGRAFVAQGPNEAGEMTFQFAAGQQCFDPHRVSLERPALFVVQGGDWRGNPRNIPVVKHTKPEFWVEDCATHMNTLATVVRRG